MDSAEKMRLQRIMTEHSSMIRTVKISDEVFHTMDDYEADPTLDDHAVEDPWYGEDEI